MILQVLFTIPGERVNLPEFGVGVQKLVFEPSSETLRASAQFLISTNLRRWLGDQINVERVDVNSVPGEPGSVWDGMFGLPGEENIVSIEITYTKNSTQERQRVQVQV